jgi:sigma-B regulation protein RsbU (phosphoserine phosphatase)
VHWVNAGHDPALVYRPEEGTFEELAGGGIPLGIDGTFAYEEQGPYALRSGDVVVIGTDGIWEAHNGADEMFGKERLREEIRAHGSQPAEQISQAITRAVSAFRGREVQNDDITLVVVKCVVAQ